MDREGTSHLVFDKQEDVHDFVTKSRHFSLQRAMNDTNTILNERMDSLVADMHQAAARTRVVEFLLGYEGRGWRGDRRSWRCCDLGGGCSLVKIRRSHVGGSGPSLGLGW